MLLPADLSDDVDGDDDDEGDDSGDVVVVVVSSAAWSAIGHGSFGQEFEKL